MFRSNAAAKYSDIFFGQFGSLVVDGWRCHCAAAGRRWAFSMSATINAVEIPDVQAMQDAFSSMPGDSVEVMECLTPPGHT